MPEPRKISNFNEEKWDQFMKIRDDVLKALEEARNNKVIGKSLESKVTIVPKDNETKEVLNSMEHLHQLLIVSEAVVAESAENAKEYRYTDVFVEKHPAETCERCWVSSDTVGEDHDHPHLCTRCASIVKENYSA